MKYLASSALGSGRLPARGADYSRMAARLLLLATLFCEPIRLVLGAPPPFPALTTVSGNPRLPGKFVWADLVTDDVRAARQFYGELFGWSFYTVGNYTIVVNAERPMCGMFQRERPKDGSAQPRWFGYISVGNVKKAQKTVAKLGARVLAAPQEFPKRGEQAVFADPEGAVFGVMKSSSGDPEDLLAEPGDWVWIELLSRDARKAGEFYRAVAGYDVVENTSSPRPEDFVFVSEGYARAAAVTLPKDRPSAAPTWLLFVRVNNLSGCVEKATQLGGKVVLPPDPKLFEGKLAVIADPTGAAVGVMQWSAAALKGGH
jgi:uncharacterized protein